MSSEPKIRINSSSILYNVQKYRHTLYTLTVLFTVLDEAGNSRFNPGLNFPAANASCNCKKNSKSNKIPYCYLLSKMRVFYLALLAICIVVEFIQNIFTSSSESILSSDEKDSSKSIVNNNVLTKF